MSVGEKIQPASMVIPCYFGLQHRFFSNFPFYRWKKKLMFDINSTLLQKRLDDFSAASIATQNHLEIVEKREQKQSNPSF